MNRFLRQSTASQSRTLGPFVDDADFKTAETGLTIANTDVKLLVNGGASANKNSGGGTHRVNGMYGFTFDATDTATVGELEVSIVVSGALPVFAVFVVLEEVIYDALFAASATGKLPATIAAGDLATDSITAAALKADAVTEIQSGLSTLDAAAVRTAVGLASANIDTQLSGIAGYIDTEVAAIKAKTDNLPSDPADESLIIAATDAIMTRLGSPAGASVSADVAAIKGDTAAVKAVTDALPDSGALTSLAQASDLAAADGKIDTLTTRLGAPADFGGGQSLAANLQDMVGSPTFDPSTDSLEALRNRGDSAWATADVSGLATASALATVDGVVDAIKVVTDKLDDTLEDNAGTYRFTEAALAEAPTGGSAPTAGEIADAVWDEDLTGHTTTDTAGQVLGDVATGTPPTAAAIADAVWDEATSGHTTAGTFGKAAGDTLAAVDTEVAAIKAKTDNLPASPAAAGDIPSASTVASAVRTELATELGRVDAAISTRATQTSVDTVAGYVDTEVAAIKAKTDLIPASPAAVGSAMTLTSSYDAAKTAASQASVDDLPTNAELATALAGADDAVLAAIAAQNDLSAADVLAAAASTPIAANVKQVNDVDLTGDGATTPWGPA